MSRTIFIFISYLLVCSTAFAQRHNTTLEGVFHNGAGRRVLLYGYTDPLSKQTILLDSTTIDSTNRLQLSFYANYPRLVVLEIENYSQSFYAEPGRTYHMHLDNFDWNQDEYRNVFLNPITLPIQFTDLPNDELNLSIAAFDRICDSVIMRHRFHFDQRYLPNRSYFDTLRYAVTNAHFANKSVFFQRYCTYQLAQLEMQLRINQREKIYDKYVENQSIPYYDECFMQFFFSLFDHSITTGSRYISTSELALALASRKASVFLDLLGQHPLLRNERVREIAAIQALYEMYFQSQYYSVEEVLIMLNSLATCTKFEEHRTMIENMIHALLPQAEAVSDLMTWQFPDEHRTMHSLDSLLGKWVYIAFVRIDDPVSVGELQTMAHFHDTIFRTIPDSVSFLTVVCDREPQKMYHFLHNNQHNTRYNWLFVHFDNQYNLLHRLGIVSYPSFILIAPDGTLKYDTAPWPATGYLLNAPWWPRHNEPTRRIYEFR